MPPWQQIAPLFCLPILLLLSWLTRTVPTAIYFPASPLRFKVRRLPSGELESDDPDPSAKGDVVAREKGSSLRKHSANSLESMSIQSFLESRVPNLFEPYNPTWWLPGGHLQTGYVVAADFSEVDKVVYERTLIRVPEGGTLGIDVTPTSNDAPDLPDDTPVIVVQHGLTGGSYESYVRSILASACAPRAEGGLGYRGAVINCRGCANVPITSAQFYSGAPTDDLRCGLLWLSHRYPNAPLIGLGFSNGANVLTRYLGEEGPRSRLRAGLSLACPWDVGKNMARMQDDFLIRNIYSKSLGANLINLFKSHLNTIRSLPSNERLSPEILDHVLSLKNPTFQEVDQALTRFIGGYSPPFPFPSAVAYQKHAASHKHVLKIRVPFLAINAEDDPIVALYPTEETSDSLTCALAVTPYGGHLGWFEGGSLFAGFRFPLLGRFKWFRTKPADRWVKTPVLQFLRAVAEDYVPDSKYGPPVLRQNLKDLVNDGTGEEFVVVEKGKDALVGFKVVAEGIIIHGASDESAKDLIAGL